MKDELKILPCPFCGTKPQVYKDDTVGCKNTLCWMFDLSAEVDDWNTRATDKEAAKAAWMEAVNVYSYLELDDARREHAVIKFEQYWTEKHGGGE